MIIEYLCLAQDEVELHIAIPVNDCSNSNQYFVHFGGLKDYRFSQSTIAIIGDWEFDAFVECLNLSIDYIDSGITQLRKTFRSKNMGIVTFELSKKSDQPDKIRLKFVFDQQIPVMNGANWRGIKEGEFAFYASISELQKLNEIFAQLAEGQDEYEQILETSREDWICPNELAYPKELITIDSLLQSAKSEINKNAPITIKNAWIELLERNCSYDVEIAICSKCSGKFSRDVKWKKQCFGCYREGRPSAFQTTENLQREIPHWLSNIELETV
ncbi:hypothetical protein [Thalassotalea sediminis]|uniref:hypothetical protein n=1 Tax=Thalassotalea sediminis TaxID=1759089 RepID=UPI0025736F88|nr:hypothetical protein [Thalassotalea sediminis]